MPKQTIIPSILSAIRRNGGKFKGTRRLAEKINQGEHVRLVVQYCRLLESQGRIIISRSRGGRGNKTIYECKVAS